MFRNSNFCKVCVKSIFADEIVLHFSSEFDSCLIIFPKVRFLISNFFASLGTHILKHNVSILANVFALYYTILEIGVN